MQLTNIPQVKLGVIAVSRDCFPVALSEERRAAVKAAYSGERRLLQNPHRVHLQPRHKSGLCVQNQGTVLPGFLVIAAQLHKTGAGQVRLVPQVDFAGEEIGVVRLYLLRQNPGLCQMRQFSPGQLHALRQGAAL